MQPIFGSSKEEDFVRGNRFANILLALSVAALAEPMSIGSAFCLWAFRENCPSSLSAHSDNFRSAPVFVHPSNFPP